MAIFGHMRKLSLVILCAFSLSISAQEKKENYLVALDACKDSLMVITKSLYASTTDSAKHRYNKQLISLLSRMLKMQGIYEYSFDSVKDIGILTSPDKMFRIYNWNIPLEDGTHEYYGFIHAKQIKVKKVGLFKKISTESYKVHLLTDYSKSVTTPENYISDHAKWYGMLYYKIIPKESNKKVFYTLLAWDGNDKFSQKKIIDVLTFDSKGNPVFGGSIFHTSNGTKKRFILEYSATCTISLKYNKSKDSIVFDHLVPTEPQLEGQYQYYCTDFTYDGFGFKKGKWNYGEFIRVANEKNEKDKQYKNPNDSKDVIRSNEIIKKKKVDSPK
jgi:hypothetical protein